MSIIISEPACFFLHVSEGRYWQIHTVLSCQCQPSNTGRYTPDKICLYPDTDMFFCLYPVSDTCWHMLIHTALSVSEARYKSIKHACIRIHAMLICGYLKQDACDLNLFHLARVITHLDIVIRLCTSKWFIALNRPKASPLAQMPMAQVLIAQACLGHHDVGLLWFTR